MIVNTIFGKVKILFAGPSNTIFVRPLDWTPQQIERMGGEKEAWLLISEEQILGNFEKTLDIETKL